MDVAMLTTTDNPFNPFTQWDQWFAYDESHGYCSSEYVARLARTSSDLSVEINNQAISNAIDEIVALNVTKNYTKVVKHV